MGQQGPGFRQIKVLSHTHRALVNDLEDQSSTCIDHVPGVENDDLHQPGSNPCHNETRHWAPRRLCEL
jgi:hypothetical protein